MSVARAPRVKIGPVAIDPVTLAGALDVIADLVTRGEGGTVFTPNVDHVVQASEDPRLKAAYDAVSLSLVDGMPVFWSTKLLGEPAPAKVSGSDLVEPLMERAAKEKWRVYFLGGAEGVGEKARDILVARYPGLQIVGIDGARVSIDGTDEDDAPIVERIAKSRAQIVMVALGAPKQEIFSERVRARVKPAVLVGVGASLDFVAGVVSRAPKWMSNIGAEWLFRLGQEPRRMWRRYLIRDPKFLLILLGEMRERRIGKTP